MGLEMSPDSRQNSQALELMGLTPSARMTMSSGQLNIKAVGDFPSEGRHSEHPGVRETISGAGCFTRERKSFEWRLAGLRNHFRGYVIKLRARICFNGRLKFVTSKS